MWTQLLGYFWLLNVSLTHISFYCFIALYRYCSFYKLKICSDGILAELFQIIKDDVVKVLHSIYQQIWKIQQWPQDWKRSVFIPISKKGNVKECSNYQTIALITHTSKVMLKILQFRLQQYMDWELPDVQAGFRKGRGTRDQIANIHWIIGKVKNLRKTSTSPLLTMPKPLSVWITTNWKILQEMGIKCKRFPEKHLFLLYWLCRSFWLCGSQ